jgi:hypothetical protein
MVKNTHKRRNNCSFATHVHHVTPGSTFTVSVPHGLAIKTLTETPATNGITNICHKKAKNSNIQ